MVTSIAGVVGLMATAALQSYTTKTDDLLSGFSVLSGGGILLFAAGELSVPEKGLRRETDTEGCRHRRVEVRVVPDPGSRGVHAGSPALLTGAPERCHAVTWHL